MARSISLQNYSGGSEMEVISPNAELFFQIDANELPEAYDPRKHQQHVDQRLAGMSGEQKARLSNLWKEKQRIHPNTSNGDASFVKVMEHVANNIK